MKKLLIFSLCLSLAVCLCACSDSRNNASEGNVPSQNTSDAAEPSDTLSNSVKESTAAERESESPDSVSESTEAGEKLGIEIGDTFY